MNGFGFWMVGIRALTLIRLWWAFRYLGKKSSHLIHNHLKTGYFIPVFDGKILNGLLPIENWILQPGRQSTIWNDIAHFNLFLLLFRLEWQPARQSMRPQTRKEQVHLLIAVKMQNAKKSKKAKFVFLGTVKLQNLSDFF